MRPRWKVEEETMYNFTEALICPACKAVLARRTVSGSSYMAYGFEDCEHFEWKAFGNKCFGSLPCRECPLGYDPSECNRIYERRVEVLQSGTTVYVLVPKA